MLDRRFRVTRFRCKLCTLRRPRISKMKTRVTVPNVTEVIGIPQLRLPLGHFFYIRLHTQSTGKTEKTWTFFPGSRSSFSLLVCYTLSLYPSLQWYLETWNIVRMSDSKRSCYTVCKNCVCLSLSSPFQVLPIVQQKCCNQVFV